MNLFRKAVSAFLAGIVSLTAAFSMSVITAAASSNSPSSDCIRAWSGDTQNIAAVSLMEKIDGKFYFFGNNARNYQFGQKPGFFKAQYNEQGNLIINAGGVFDYPKKGISFNIATILRYGRNIIPNAEAAALMFLVSDGETCYGLIHSNNGDSFVYPVMIPEEDLEDALTTKSFDFFDTQFGRATSEAEMIISTQRQSDGGCTCVIDPNTTTGKKFVEGIKNATKGFSAITIVRKGIIYDLAGGEEIVYGTFKPQIDLLSPEEKAAKEKEEKSKISMSSLRVAEIASQPYTGKAIKPDVKITLNGNYTLKKGTDYTLKYQNNTKIGTASVTITLQGKYTGSKTLNFSIVPKAPALKASKSDKKFNLSWSKVSNIDGYQIQYSTNGGSTYKSAGTVSSAKTACTLSLDTSKKHIFKIRAYKKVNGKKVYSAWSNEVTVKK